MIAALLLAASLRPAPAVHHAVTTTNTKAQALFDRGLALLYAYNGPAARIAFEAALEEDPHLAMAAWGQTLADATDVNTPLTPQRFANAQADAKVAKALERFASPEEQMYIDAVAQRYAGDYAHHVDDDTSYRAAMARLVQAYPLDDDAALFDAEALLEHTGVENPDPQALVLIDRVLARSPENIFANHLCVHAYDYAADRTPALACANRLASWSFDPAEEHLAHVPAHTYMETGDYAKALASAEYAWSLREQWDNQPNPPFPLRYGAHDAYIGWTAALMLGNLQTAELWAGRVGREYGGSDLWVTWARFGEWERILHSSSANQFFAPLSLGLADIHLGHLTDARAMLRLYANTDGDFRWLLAAAIDEQDGNISQAVADIAHAQAYQQRVDGAEQIPIFPAGEALGSLYLREREFAQSAQAFEETLRLYPNDPRALYGLAQAQVQLGQAVTSAQTLKTFNAIWTARTPPDLADL